MDLCELCQDSSTPEQENRDEKDTQGALLDKTLIPTLAAGADLRTTQEDRIGYGPFITL